MFHVAKTFTLHLMKYTRQLNRNSRSIFRECNLCNAFNALHIIYDFD